MRSSQAATPAQTAGSGAQADPSRPHQPMQGDRMTAFLFLLAWLMLVMAFGTLWSAYRMDTPMVLHPNQIRRSAWLPGAIGVVCLAVAVFG